MKMAATQDGYGADELRIHNVIFVLVAVPVAFLVMFAPLHLFPGYGASDLPFVAELALGIIHFCVIVAITVVVGRYIADKAVLLRRKRLTTEKTDERL